jgi:hypothetical protein
MVPTIRKGLTNYEEGIYMYVRYFQCGYDDPIFFEDESYGQVNERGKVKLCC